MNSAKGLTLVELLVALIIGLVLVGGVAQIFVSNKQAYHLSDELARMQESARYAFYVLSRDLRMAGYLGCNSRSRAMVPGDDPDDPDAGEEMMRVNVAFSSSVDTFTPRKGIEGWEARNTGYADEFSVIENAPVTVDAASSSIWTPGGGAKLEDDKVYPVANSDIIRVWQAQGDPVIATAVSPTDLTLAESHDFEPKDVLMITDCTNVDIVVACGVSGTSVSLDGCSGAVSNDTSKPLFNDTGSHVDKLVGYVYYVSKRERDANNPPALFRREIGKDAVSPRAQELVEGVESIQFLYGEDTDTTNPDGIANRYVEADDVGDWKDVVSVRVAMLVQSERADLVDVGVGQSQTFDFNGAPVTVDDGRLRYPYVATVSLRNRLQ